MVAVVVLSLLQIQDLLLPLRLPLLHFHPNLKRIDRLAQGVEAQQL